MGVRVLSDWIGFEIEFMYVFLKSGREGAIVGDQCSKDCGYHRSKDGSRVIAR